MSDVRDIRSLAPSATGEGSRPRTIVALGETKTGKPDFFYRDRHKTEDWLTQLDLYFVFNPTKDNYKTLTASTYMRGQAQHWINTYLKLFFNKKKDDEEIIQDFDVFKEKVRNIFGMTNEKNAAIRVIQVIRQKTSAIEYTARFKENSILTG